MASWSKVSLGVASSRGIGCAMAAEEPRPRKGREAGERHYPSLQQGYGRALPAAPLHCAPVPALTQPAHGCPFFQPAPTGSAVTPPSRLVARGATAPLLRSRAFLRTRWRSHGPSVGPWVLVGGDLVVVVLVVPRGAGALLQQLQDDHNHGPKLAGAEGRQVKVLLHGPTWTR